MTTGKRKAKPFERQRPGALVARNLRVDALAHWPRLGKMPQRGCAETAGNVRTGRERRQTLAAP
jgi:hypothetical protein